MKYLTWVYKSSVFRCSSLSFLILKLYSSLAVPNHLGLRLLAEIPLETSELVTSWYFFPQTLFMLAAYMYLMSPFQTLFFYFIKRFILRFFHRLSCVLILLFFDWKLSYLLLFGLFESFSLKSFPRFSVL